MVEPRVLRPVLRFQLAVYQRAVPIPCDLKRLCCAFDPVSLWPTSPLATGATERSPNDGGDMVGARAMSSQIWSRSTHAVRQTRQRSRTQRLLRLLTLRSSQDSSPPTRRRSPNPEIHLLPRALQAIRRSPWPLSAVTRPSSNSRAIVVRNRIQPILVQLRRHQEHKLSAGGDRLLSTVVECNISNDRHGVVGYSTRCRLTSLRVNTTQRRPSRCLSLQL